MANKRIIDLTAAGAFALTDLLEIDTGAFSLKITGQQVYNLIAATLNTSTVSLGNNLFHVSNAGLIYVADGTGLNADGSAVLKGTVIVNNDIEARPNTAGFILHSRPSDNLFRIIVDDVGTLGTEAA